MSLPSTHINSRKTPRWKDPFHALCTFPTLYSQTVQRPRSPPSRRRVVLRQSRLSRNPVHLHRGAPTPCAAIQGVLGSRASWESRCCPTRGWIGICRSGKPHPLACSPSLPDQRFLIGSCQLGCLVLWCTCSIHSVLAMRPCKRSLTPRLLPATLH